MNFVIFGQARTGSSLFVTLLQSHPQVQCAGELLGYDFSPPVPKRLHGRVRRWIRQFPEPYILWAASKSKKPAYGFKLLYLHAADPRRVLSFLFKRHWQIIHIQRHCLFDLAISRSVAIKTRRFGEYLSSGHRQEPSIEIPPEEFVRHAEQCIHIRRNELSALRDMPHITVRYEADLLSEGDRNRICGTIFDTLHLEPHLVSTTRVPTWDRPYSEIVTNYAELQALMGIDQGLKLQAAWDHLFAAG